MAEWLSRSGLADDGRTVDVLQQAGACRIDVVVGAAPRLSRRRRW